MLSIAIITYNEEKNIERCLKQAVKLTSDIVVVDSNSEDKTVEIAKKYGARIFQRDFIDFANQKNFANQQTKHNWVLSLDADEELSEELILSLKAIDFEKEKNVLFALKRITNYCGKWIRFGGWYPDIKIRIWNKTHVKWEGSVHEKPIIPDNFYVKALNGDLYHYSYYNIEEHKKQAEKFGKLNAEKLREKGQKSNFLNIVFSPSYKFFSMYILKLGFLDGYYGFVIAKISAKSTFIKHKHNCNI